MNKKLLTLCALMGMAVATNAAAAGTAAGTSIVNTAYLESLKDDGTPDTSVPSNAVTLTVQHVPSLTITPNGDATTPGQIVYGQPGQTAVLTYVLTNTSNNEDDINLQVTGTQNANTANATLFRETDSIPGLTPGDAAITGPIHLLPDESTTFYIGYAVNAAAPSSDVYDITPIGRTVATLAGAPAVDSDNLGRIMARDVYSVNFNGQDQAGTTTSPGTISYTHVLTNNGNTPITASQIDLMVGPVPGSWTYSYAVGGAAPAATPAQAMTNWGGTLAPGATLNIVVTVSAPNNLPQNTQDITSIAVALNPASSPEIDNTSSVAQDATDTTTIIKGIGSVTKSVVSCGVNPLCPAPTMLNNGDLVKPSELLRYTVVASNVGNSGLKRAIVADVLPANTLGVNYSATFSGVTPGQVLYRTINGAVTSPWTLTAPDITNLEGVRVEAGFDMDQDGDVDAVDMLPAGTNLTMTLNVKVK